MYKIKESGIEWAEKIPMDFNIVRMQDIGNYKKGPFGSSITLNMFVDKGDETIKVYEQKNAIYEDAELGSYYITHADFQKLKDFEVCPGDIIVSCAGTIGKCYVMPEAMERGIINQALMRITLLPTVNKEYFMYLFGVVLEEMAKVFSNGSAIKNIPPFSVLKKYKMPVPPFDKQQSIISFLDCKCAEIDALAADIQAQIDTLEQYKRSIVTEAVTKGINPNAEMKDSGVQWIGKMPSHWETIRGKHILQYLQKPVMEDDGVVTCFRDGEVTLRSNRREDGFTLSEKEIGYQGIDVGDLIVHGMDGFAGSIGISNSRGKASPVLNVLDSKQNKRYLMYYLRSMAYSDVFLAMATGIRVRSCDLRWNKLSELFYPVPPIEEQEAIVRHIDSTLKKSDEIIADKKKLLEVLSEYKKSVVYEYVTGKKEVAT